VARLKHNFKPFTIWLVWIYKVKVSRLLICLEVRHYCRLQSIHFVCSLRGSHWIIFKRGI